MADEILTCEICGTPSTEAPLRTGLGGAWCDGDCPPRYDHPRQLRPRLEWVDNGCHGLEADAWEADVSGGCLFVREDNGAYCWSVQSPWVDGESASLVEAQCAAEDALRAFVAPIVKALGEGGENG